MSARSTAAIVGASVGLVLFILFLVVYLLIRTFRRRAAHRRAPPAARPGLPGSITISCAVPESQSPSWPSWSANRRPPRAAYTALPLQPSTATRPHAAYTALPLQPFAATPPPPGSGSYDILGSADFGSGSSPILGSADLPSGSAATLERKLARFVDSVDGTATDGRRPKSHARAGDALALVDAGRPDVITASAGTVGGRGGKGKPGRPKRARTALAAEGPASAT
jgi:hypothetical protein